MNFRLLAMLFVVSALFFTACGDDDDTMTPTPEPVDESTIILRENITSDATWESDKIYVLGGRITVESGATLTIQPGTVIKAEAGTGANATALLVARGGTLIAEGTADAPIIFTSIADEITPEQVAGGDFASPNLDPDINGLWGGVIVLGNATISASNDNDEDLSEVQIEGIPSTDTNGLYGGSDDGDNSGVISHISIRHGGANIGAGNEINGLTLGGVGSATTINNVEVVANQDDGIEWFGGTVDVNNVIVWNAGDDAIDTDQSWAGTLDNFFVVTPVGSCFELDGPEGSYIARHTIKNGTVVAGIFELNDDDELELVAGATGFLIDVDAGDNPTPVDMSDIHFVGPFASGQTVTDDEAVEATFSNVTFAVDDPADLEGLMEEGTVPSGISAGGSPVADKSGLGWTWASIRGGLDGL